MVNHIWINFDLGNCGFKDRGGCEIGSSGVGEYNTLTHPYAEAGTHKLLITEIRAEKTLHSVHGHTIRRLGSC